MITRQVEIINKLGLHARAAAQLVKVCTAFESNITLRSNLRSADGKSIMGVMMLEAAKGTELSLSVDGSDEEEAASAVTDLIENRFGENE